MVKVMSKQFLSIAIIATMTLSIIGVTGISTSVSACANPIWGPWSWDSTQHFRICQGPCSDQQIGRHAFQLLPDGRSQCTTCRALFW